MRRGLATIACMNGVPVGLHQTGPDPRPTTAMRTSRLARNRAIQDNHIR